MCLVLPHLPACPSVVYTQGEPGSPFLCKSTVRRELLCAPTTLLTHLFVSVSAFSPGPIHELSRLSSKANPTPGISDTSPFADTRAFRSYFSPALSPLRALRGSLTSAYRRVVTASVFADSLSSAPPQLLHPFSATRSRSSPKGGLDLLPVPASFSKALRSGFCPHHPTKTFSSRLPMTARAPGGLSQSSVCLQLGS